MMQTFCASMVFSKFLLARQHDSEWVRLCSEPGKRNLSKFPPSFGGSSGVRGWWMVCTQKVKEMQKNVVHRPECCKPSGFMLLMDQLKCTHNQRKKRNGKNQYDEVRTIKIGNEKLIPRNCECPRQSGFRRGGVNIFQTRTMVLLSLAVHVIYKHEVGME